MSEKQCPRGECYGPLGSPICCESCVLRKECQDSCDPDLVALCKEIEIGGGEH